MNPESLVQILDKAVRISLNAVDNVINPSAMSKMITFPKVSCWWVSQGAKNNRKHNLVWLGYMAYQSLLVI